ncbi:hypothetical protein GGR53DRAFT_461946 [Hypoxylon sp. FL1150]|nr:hypothetical protein GGR53DRAFT_461946 [Hypoxylon sp. FL1150]
MASGLAVAAYRTPVPMSSITVRIDDLEDWGDDWLDWYRDYTDPEVESEVFENGELTMLWEIYPAATRKEDEEGGRATFWDFVTMQDYLSTVHPWLLSKRDDTLATMGMFGDKLLPQDTKLVVGYGFLNSPKMEDWAELVASTKRKAGKSGLHYTKAIKLARTDRKRCGVKCSSTTKNAIGNLPGLNHDPDAFRHNLIGLGLLSTNGAKDLGSDGND